MAPEEFLKFLSDTRGRTRIAGLNAGADDYLVKPFAFAELLECLMRYQGQVVSREALARDVWKETARSTPLDNVIDVQIARLRRKVDADQPTRLIHTIRGPDLDIWVVVFDCSKYDF